MDGSKGGPAHSGIASALAAAQMEMGVALKDSVNPDFRSKYADLANVMNACLPALNRNGIAVIQPTGRDADGTRYVETILIHGESGERLSCRVDLIIGKNDMQGFGSACTYARRYGLMGMAGIAPEDDDGNAAVKSQGANGGATRITRQSATQDADVASKLITGDQFLTLRGLIEEGGVDEAKFLAFLGADSLETLTVRQFEDGVAAIRRKLAAERAA